MPGEPPCPRLSRLTSFAISLPVGNWIVFYSFVIDHEIPFAYERPLCAAAAAQKRSLNGNYPDAFATSPSCMAPFQWT
jgi:hypothetical protein